MVDATGTVGHPYNPQLYIDPDKNYTPSGFAKVFGFLDGVQGITGRVEGITGDYADIAGNVTDGRRSVWELRRDKDAFETEQLLEKLKVNRGDNVQLYWAGGAVAVAIVFLLNQ